MNLFGRLPCRKFLSSWPPMLIQMNNINLYITQRNQTIKPNQSNILELIYKYTKTPKGHQRTNRQVQPFCILTVMSNRHTHRQTHRPRYVGNTGAAFSRFRMLLFSDTLFAVGTCSTNVGVVLFNPGNPRTLHITLFFNLQNLH